MIDQTGNLVVQADNYVGLPHRPVLMYVCRPNIQSTRRNRFFDPLGLKYWPYIVYLPMIYKPSQDTEPKCVAVEVSSKWCIPHVSRRRGPVRKDLGHRLAGYLQEVSPAEDLVSVLVEACAVTHQRRHVRRHVLGPLFIRLPEEPCARIDHAAYHLVRDPVIYQLHFGKVFKVID